MRIALFASSAFALPVLELLNRSSHEVVAVYTQPPRVSGRGLLLKHGELAQRAIKLSLNLLHPENINNTAQLKYFSSLDIDVAIVVAYGQILSDKLLSLPKWGFLNLHPSLLPRWRGAAPIERAILEGDKHTGVCTIKMVKQIDAGPILAKEDITIGLDMTAKNLSELLSEIGARQLVKILERFPQIIEVPQSKSGITYAHKISKRETKINWGSPAEIIDRMIRGLSPSPGAWCSLNGLRVKLLNSRVLPLKGKPGSRVKIDHKCSEKLIIACGGESAIEISSIQLEGKKPVTGVDFIRGYRGTIYFE